MKRRPPSAPRWVTGPPSPTPPRRSPGWRGRYRLVILSNVDRRSFAASNRRLGAVFDRIVTAEDVGAYKPDRAMFDALLAAVEAMGSERSRLLHVAESLYHDHQPAAAAGIDSVWIHRRFDRDGFGATHPPDGEVHPKWRFTSMAAFAEAAVPFPPRARVSEQGRRRR